MTSSKKYTQDLTEKVSLIIKQIKFQQPSTIVPDYIERLTNKIRRSVIEKEVRKSILDMFSEKKGTKIDDKNQMLEK